MKKKRRITKHVFRKITSFVLSAAMLLSSAPDMVPVQAAGGTKAAEPDKLCELTFDGEDPLEAGNATAIAPESYSTVDYNGGKALQLNGSSQYLSLTAGDGSSLLKGKEEFTISYDINNLRSSTNWPFFAAPDDRHPTDGGRGENYIGCLYSGSNMTVERYRNGRVTPLSHSITTSTESGWHHYDVVVQEDVTRIFKDGELSATSESTPTKVSDILGENGIFYIGKATWGEFCQAQIDNFIIYDGVLENHAEQIIAEVKAGLSIGNISAVKNDIELPSRRLGVDISWESDNQEVIKNDGMVKKGEDDTQVKLTATLSCGEYGKTDTKEFEATVLKDDGLTVDDYIAAEYDFDDNYQNTAGGEAKDEAEVYTQNFSIYDGNVTYEEGIKGKAVRVGNYGFKLNKQNIGKDYTVMMWVKPDGTLPENQVMLFLGHYAPEKWIGVSGSNDTSQVKIWGNGGTLPTHTTLFAPQISAGTWHQLVLTGTDGIVTSYLDGVKLGEDYRSNDPLDGENQDIYLAVNYWPNDSCYKGLIDDVKVYTTPLSSKQVENSYSQMLVDRAAESFTLENTTGLKNNITLPSEASDGVSIEWATSEESVITKEGVITRGDTDKSAVLTATFKLGSAEKTKEFDITVAGIDKLCELTFDNTDDPLAAGNAKATAPASYGTAEHDSGKALALDGSSQYLSLTAGDGSSLLKGKEEFTISYDINVGRANPASWVFYAAPNDNEQIYPNEEYFGGHYKDGKFNVERYCHGRNNGTSSTLNSDFTVNEWHHYDVVVQQDVTRIFKDGTLSATSASTTKFSEIFGDNGIFYIGKANWESGEFCQAQIDNFIIYDGILGSHAEKIIEEVKTGLSIGDISAVKDDIDLPARKLGVDISWESDNQSVIKNDGTVKRGENDTQVKLTATLSCGGYGKTDTKEFEATVLRDDGSTIDDYLVAEYDFENNYQNTAGEEAKDEAQVYAQKFSTYSGSVTYEEGIKGQAVRVGDYGFKLNKQNLGTDYTVMMWVKPDGTFPENQVMLFLGYHSPEKWIGVSGSNGTSTVKIWGNGGTFSTWTTMFSPQISQGTWHQLVLTGTDGVITSYLDGVKIGEDNRSNNPLSGDAQDIYIAVNNWDTQFKGLVDAVKVYTTPLSSKQVQNSYNQMIVDYEAEHFVLENTEQLREDITLPTEASNGVSIEWSTSDESAITKDGVITRGEADKEADLTATFTLGEAVKTRQIHVTIAAVNDQADAEAAKELLNIPAFAAEDITLPNKGMYGTDITWASSDDGLMDSAGKIGDRRPEPGAGNVTVTLTATITKGLSSATKEFVVTIMEKPYGYIYGYIRGNNDRTGSLHISYSTDKKEFTALNGNSGILFAKNDTSDGNKTLSTGVRFAGIGLYRNADGSFVMTAPQGKDNTALYVYNSTDLLSYTGGELVTPKDNDYDTYKAAYESAKADTAGMTIPEGASNGSIIAVTKAEYENILQRFDIVTNTGVTVKVEKVTVDTEDELAEKLPKTATATYSDGSEAALNITWDTDKVNMSSKGTYTLTGTITPYSNPLIEQRADPQIKYDEDKDCYYFTASYPAYNNADNGYDRIVLRKADSIQELSDDNGGKDKEITIWKAPSSGQMARHVWAPELHNINGKWYVFFAAGNSDNIFAAIRPYVLVCQDNSDPYNADNWKKEDGTYEIHMAESKDSRYFKNMSLDMTYFEHNGKHYVIWADIIGQSALYMQQIDPSQPWVGISDKVVMLTTPEFGWERDSERVNEGPTILKHDGKIFCAFSASGTGPEYCIGMLYADEDSDLLDSASWTKLGYPLLTSADVPGEYGPGHNSFTVDKEGNPVFVYHARSEECYNNQCEWANSDPLYDPCRHARVKNVHWTKDGLPILKMNAEEECPESMRSVSVQVEILVGSDMELKDAVISGYQSEYEETGSPVKPEITVTYKGSELQAGKDYTVEYGANTEPGKGTITINAVEGSGYKGSQTVEFTIIQKPVVKVKYDMASSGSTLNNIAGDNYDAALTGLTGNNFVTYNSTSLMLLNADGYASLPKGIIDDNTFTMSVVASTEKANNQWLLTLGRNSWNYAFMTPSNSSSNTKFAVAQHDPYDTTGAWNYEEKIETPSAGRNGSFHLYTVVVDGNKTAMYVDGVKVGTGSNSYDITSFFEGLDVIGYIGKSLYDGDPLFAGAVGDFTVYDNALTDAQVAREAESADLNKYLAAYIYGIMLNGNDSSDNIKTNLSFPANVCGTAVKWEIPDGQTVIDANGNVVRPVDGDDVTVSVKAVWGDTTETYTLVVKAQTIDSVLDDLVLPYSTQEGMEVYGNITLPDTTDNGIKIKWTSDHPDIVDVSSHVNEGYDDTPAGTVHRPDRDTIVKLTAEIEIDGKTASKEYVFTVKKAPEKINEEDYTDYFFAYFTGEGSSNGEQIYFATSEDGLNWSELNNGQPSLISTMGEKGVRDPFIIRSAEGDKFYIIATDLKINGGSGWSAAQTAGSQSLMVWESTDLVNWSKQRMVEVSASIGAGCTWAPEATYDAKTGEYIVYWASKTESDKYSKQRVYYAKTRDFYSFTEPQVYIELDQSTIDTTMIEYNGTYYRYSKNEGGSVNQYGANSKTIFIEKSDGVLGKFTNIASPSLNSNGGVEGPTIFKLNNDDADTDTWCLLVDNYGSGGYYPLMTTDLESGVFARPVSGTYKMPSGARHGTPIRLTREEYCKVMGIPYEPQTTQSPSPTPEPSSEPTQEPTPTKAPEPTKEPTQAPTPTKAPEPTKEPTQAPTPTKAPEPTKEPTQAPDVTEPPVVTEEPSATESPQVTEEPSATQTPPASGGQTSEDAPRATDGAIPQQPSDNQLVYAGPVIAKQAKVTKKSIKAKWNPVSGADGYRIYYAVNKKALKKYKDVSGEKTSVKLNKLKKGKYYRIRVSAYRIVDGKEVIISTAPDIYVTTKGGKYVNPVKFKKIKKKSVTVKASGKTKLKVKLKKSRIKNYVKNIRYFSSDTAVAKVNKKGRVTGVSAGNCVIYCYAQNGKYKKIKVTVK